MKKLTVRLLAATAALLTIAFAVPATASAVTPFSEACKGGGAGSAVCSNNTGGNDPIAGPNGAIVNVTSILAVITGVVSVAFVIWGGIKYITSGGDSSGVSTAKNTVMAALIGLVLALLARPIILFIVGRL